ncbi:MAG: polyprenyl synthetase family protein [Weeksellaceae bacterium]|jgi:geranylgeranyl diphosphate synthase type II|nr:polyprenyl synthetase family protein [Weeksellaceae bacterium]MDX9705745.1 polyprenyl synthetase family protein [Weeksellaceae bacterium]
MDILEQYKQIVEKALQTHNFNHRTPKELYEPCDYILNLGGKHLRPLVTLLGNYVFDGNVEEAIKPALAIEYFHNFTLMHDDIMDEAPLRRSKQTVHLKYGINTGILSGDALLIESYKMFEDLSPDKYKAVVQLFTQTAAELCEGQQMDMNFENQKKVSYEDYIEMIRLKTSVLVGAAFQIGAIIAGASEKEQKKLYEFGLNLGIAFQLKDDYLDVFGEQGFGKIHAGDIYENKKTILYIQALETADENSLKELNHWYQLKTNDSKKVDAVIEIFKKLKINESSMRLIEFFTEKAQKNLNEIEASDEKKNVLRNLAYSLINRQI